ncbi:hypothetical protein V1514DRAFT_339260 [Lipomyces japonicus]|uniref:uncharacterized protein n=1 Tax=Lipomyces japonicus TaxID=56871 RepID=UPI0034CE9E9D
MHLSKLSAQFSFFLIYQFQVCCSFIYLRTHMVAFHALWVGLLKHLGSINMGYAISACIVVAANVSFPIKEQHLNSSP